MVFQPARYAARQERKQKMIGWEQVRIERTIPQKDCTYVIQEACSNRGAECYNTFRKNAIIQGANVVVITDLGRGQRSSGSMSVYNGAGGGGFSSVDSITALADYYNCPGYKYSPTMENPIKEQK